MWQENEHVAAIFLLCRTQFRWGPAGPVGLDYAAVSVACGWAGLTVDKDDMAKLQLCESSYISAFYDRA